VKKSRKGKALRERKAAFKTWLILNDVTQKELARQLGLCSSAISMMIERGKFTDGVFAEWWKANITGDAIARNKRNEKVNMEEIA